MKKGLLGASLLLLLALSWPALQGSDRDLNYTENTIRILKAFFPPDLTVWREVLGGLWETIQISVVATLLAGLISIPLGLGTSKKLSPKILRTLILGFLSWVRAIPSLVWALVSVAIIGPFPRAGVVALIFYSLGYLGKFFADLIDSQNLQISQFLIRSGAHPIQAFQYGLWPEIKAQFRHQILWMLEYNIRSASIIGYVGAGGLGTYLHIYQEYGRWDRFSFVIFLIFFIAIFFEFLGRKKPTT